MGNDLTINNAYFFDAQTAKERSVRIQSGALQDELKSIYTEIQKAINAGDRSISKEDWLISTQAEDFLKNKGFGIKHFYGDQRDSFNETTITW